MVGADRGQLVLLTQGSSCRWTARTDDRPMDTLVVAIVDAIDQGGAVKWPAAKEVSNNNWTKESTRCIVRGWTSSL
jgi:hypothetical protein